MEAFTFNTAELILLSAAGILFIIPKIRKQSQWQSQLQ